MSRFFGIEPNTNHVLGEEYHVARYVSESFSVCSTELDPEDENENSAD